jgi:hypothetical protein
VDVWRREVGLAVGHLAAPAAGGAAREGGAPRSSLRGGRPRRRWRPAPRWPRRAASSPCTVATSSCRWTATAA